MQIRINAGESMMPLSLWNMSDMRESPPVMVSVSITYRVGVVELGNLLKPAGLIIPLHNLFEHTRNVTQQHV